MVTYIQAKFVLPTFVHISNIPVVTDPILTKLFGPNVLQTFDLNFVWTLIFLDPKFCGPKILWTQIFLDIYLFNLNISSPKILGTKYVWTRVFSGPKFCWTQKKFDPYLFLTQNYIWPQNFVDQKVFLSKKDLDKGRIQKKNNRIFR